MADPHTLGLYEATSLMPPPALHLEARWRVLADRTGCHRHRSHTAHDADLIAVVIDGRIAELGPPS